MKHTAKRIQRNLWLSPEGLVTKVLFAIALLLVLLLIWVVFFFGHNSFDDAGFSFTAQFVTAARTKFMLFITFLGNHVFLIPANLLFLAYFLVRKDKWAAIGILMCSLGGLGIKLLLKQLFHRFRPIDPLIEGGVPGYSFPSGHALMSVVFYGFLIWLCAHKIRNGWLQFILISLLAILILLISLSRVYLRVHYPTDITAGLCIGFMWLSFCLWFINKKEVKHYVRMTNPLAK
jgi:membrane-associated phospholipid phosphatase